ncbi:pirin family protein [Mycetohabitans rhizoxinica]|uniref:pirin family protein n=1 Tax=Mycetohabitans rhizoxinica TaxID=412963 RepID=UPI0030CBA5B4
MIDHPSHTIAAARSQDVRARAVQQVVPAQRTVEGAGFVVHRPFPTRTLTDFDPFLLLDEMGPVDYAPGQAVGAPAHPHRGFETVTYMLEGEFAHRDSAGHAGTLGPGDVQWMTAGVGVVHSEMPAASLLEHGGRSHGFQLWVNLPRRDKMMAPRYQELPGARIPVARTPDGHIDVKVIAGEALGVSAAIQTRTPILFQHFRMQPGATLMHPVPDGFRMFAYALDNGGRYGAQQTAAGARQMVVFDNVGDTIMISATDRPLQFLLIGGVPLNEPIVRYGPFVMNTEDEIRQAVADYRDGKFGHIAA